MSEHETVSIVADNRHCLQEQAPHWPAFAEWWLGRTRFLAPYMVSGPYSCADTMMLTMHISPSFTSHASQHPKKHTCSLRFCPPYFRSHSPPWARPPKLPSARTPPLTP